MRLVVDTCIYCSSTNNKCNPHTNAQRSRAILELIYNQNHTIVISPELEREYKDNFSSFGYDWYAEMRKAGKVQLIEDHLNIQLRNELQYGVCLVFSRDGKDKIRSVWREIDRDIHLIEVALLTDNAVISDELVCYENIRSLTVEESIHSIFHLLRSIKWIIPENCIDFLEELSSWLKGEEDHPCSWFLLNGTGICCE